MRRPLGVVFVLVLIALSYAAVSWYAGQAAKASPEGKRRILYYRDPMHPAYKSEKPGIAPDCGMQLEPVYADGAGHPDSTAPRSPVSPGSMSISPEAQQILGVRTVAVENVPINHSLHLLGRVVADETRIVRVTSGEGWVRRIYPNATGTIVRKDEPLATIYSKELLQAQVDYLNRDPDDAARLLGVARQSDGKKSSGSMGSGAGDRKASAGGMSNGAGDGKAGTCSGYSGEGSGDKAGECPMAKMSATSRAFSGNLELRAMGMSASQIEEVSRTGQPMPEIELRAPIAGYLLARNATAGMKFEQGAELYRIADLSRVWILADLFENEAGFFRPGTEAEVRVPNQNRVYKVRVSDVLPHFDPSSRTLKVRLEADNPDYSLRPDMFVDVDLKLRLKPVISVPMDALLDSGRHKRVFVAQGGGGFETREVETGGRMGDRIEIVRGLSAGERVAVSGTFLLDSESRMRAADAGTSAAAVKDPVCGMDIDQNRVSLDGKKSEYGGKTFYFCSDNCKRLFDGDQQSYVGTTATGASSGSGGGQ